MVKAFPQTTVLVLFGLIFLGASAAMYFDELEDDETTFIPPENENIPSELDPADETEITGNQVTETEDDETTTTSEKSENIPEVDTAGETEITENQVTEDEYIQKTQKSRDDLIEIGYYFENTIFGNVRINSPEVRSLEHYVPKSSTIFHGDRRNVWPKSFQRHLVRMNKSVLDLVDFILYTKKNTAKRNDTPEILDPSDLRTIKSSSWNSSANTVILIHDYRQNMHTLNMPQQLKDAYLEMNRTDNIVVVNWGPLAYERNYFESAMYSHKVGNYVGEFLIFMRNAKLIKDFHMVHIIGLGLGAQAAAAASKYMKDRAGGLPVIGRITGLDPALPGFNMRAELYLDESDAAYVDIIHTNGGENFYNGQFGVYRQLGHSDFYPNGGVNQPTCGDYNRVGDLISACSHWKAADYYRRSIVGEVFRSCPCASWGEYDYGTCNCTSGPYMGEYVSLVYGKFYLHVFEKTLFELIQDIDEDEEEEAT